MMYTLQKGSPAQVVMEEMRIRKTRKKRWTQPWGSLECRKGMKFLRRARAAIRIPRKCTRSVLRFLRVSGTNCSRVYTENFLLLEKNTSHNASRAIAYMKLCL